MGALDCPDAPMLSAIFEATGASGRGAPEVPWLGVDTKELELEPPAPGEPGRGAPEDPELGSEPESPEPEPEPGI
jgi:hypothetical protein